MSRITCARRVAAALGLAAALAGCGGGAGTLVPGPERPTARLSAADVDGIAALLRQEDRREYDAGSLERLARSPTPEVRRRAALAAGRIGDTAAVPLLSRLLREDPSFGVRADAAFALGELGDTSAQVVRDLEAAVRGDWTPVRAEQTTLAVEVVAALGKLGTSAARSSVAAALRDAYPAPDIHSRRVAAEALLALWRFGPGPGRVGPLLPYLETADPELRWRAAYALMRLGQPETVGPLLSRADDPEHRARAAVARGLPRPRADSAGLADSARAVLGALLDDSHPHVRINALRALATYGGDAPLEAMAARIGDPRDDVAVAAAGALGSVGARAAPRLAAAAAAADRPLAVRAAALLALATLDAEAAVATVRGWAAGGDAERYEAARLLATLGWDLAADLFDTLADDASPRVAVAAHASAESLAGDSALAAPARGPLAAWLAERARADDPRQRAIALRALEALRSAGAPEPERAGSSADSLARTVAIADAERSTAPEREPPRDEAFYRGIVTDLVARPLETGERPEARISTAGGEIVLELLAEEAPLTVHNFLRLARAGYFDGGVWHRVVPNFVLQDGAPSGDPSGGPGWAIRDEINRVRYDRGTLGMALSGPDTGGSQWFITHSPQPHLDGGYTVFGRVRSGMDVADRVLQGEPIQSIRVGW